VDYDDKEVYIYDYGLDYPENVTIDAGDDGTIDYINDTEFNTSETIPFNDSAIAAINAYLHDTFTADWATGTCDVPINVSSVTAGILEISGISFVGEYLYGYYNMTIYDEMDGESFNTSNMTLTIMCENDTQTTTITNHTTNNIWVTCDAYEFWLTINDDEGNTHWRTLTPDEEIGGTVEFFMINETGYTTIRQNWIIYDVTGDFTNGSVTVYKVVPDLGKQVTIEQPIDAESKVTLYLIVDELYEFEVINADGTYVRNVGGYLADTDTDKRLMVSTIPYAPDQFLTFKDVLIYFDWDKDTGYIRGYYNDSLGETTTVTFTVYNATNISQVMYTSSSSSSVVTFTYNGVDTDGTYVARITALHSRYGTITEEKMVDFGGAYTVSGLAGLGYGIYSSVAAGLISTFVMLSFRRKHAAVGSVVFVVLMLMFMNWGWFGSSPMLTWGILTLVAFMAFANMMVLRRGSS